MTGAGGTTLGHSVYRRMFPAWDGYFAVVTVAVAVAVLADRDTSAARRAGSVAAGFAIALLYAGFGRRLARMQEHTAGAGVLVPAQAALFGVAVACCSTSTYLLFAVIPMVFLTVRLRLAAPLILLLNVIPLAVAAVQEGMTARLLTHLLPIAAISVAFSLWLGFWVSRVIDQSSERAALIDELRESRAQVQRLSHESGVAAERARLAGEIHDTLAQGFTSIITLLQAADPDLRDERLALAVRTARENLAESRAMIVALTPSALGSDSLPEAVRRQVARFTEETGVPGGCRVTGEPRALPTATEVVLLRAAQEALTNVRRHAGAREVAVLLAYTPTAVRLVVRDDGGGFDPAGAGGFGLAGMRARAAQVDGGLTVRSDPDTGTTVELEVPA